jgi:hypothetical protein
MLKIPAGTPALNTRHSRISAFVQETIDRARAVRVPYKLGEVVIGEDPFNGRIEGVVVAKNGPLVGLQTAGRTFFYDYRQLWRAD